MGCTTKTLSSPSVASQGAPPPNPYQRMASRRAIACVTCAKAKTKCDKGLPACSRCITKGIKCEPRSTRRTSENSYRTNIKKPFVSPKRYHSTSTVQSLSQFSPPRKATSSVRHQSSRTVSDMDFGNTLKMDYNASICSGFPTLTPLPTYTSPTVESCYSYPILSDRQSLSDYAPALETNDFPIAGRLTPQTPEPLVYHEQLTMGGMPDRWTASRSWSDGSFGPVELGFDSDTTTMLSTGFWPTFSTTHALPATQTLGLQSSLSASPQTMSHELVPHAATVPSLSNSECSVEDFRAVDVFQEGWATYHPGTTQLGMVNIIAQVPFVHGLSTDLGTAPMWEDIFMHESPPY